VFDSPPRCMRLGKAEEEKRRKENYNNGNQFQKLLFN
jgi:hypothetical protein